ncbi:MAG: PP2C family protein-serine/threonine phosphatase [Solirubrobacteraceae bacterium]
MPRRSQQRSRSRCLRLTAVAVCGALALICASIALAKPDHGGQGHWGGGSEQGGGAAHESHGGGGSAGHGETPAANTTHGHGKEAGGAGESGHGQGHDGKGGESGAGSGPATGAGGSEHGHGHGDHGQGNGNDNGSHGSGEQKTGEASGQSSAGSGNGAGHARAKQSASRSGTAAASHGAAANSPNTAAVSTTPVSSPAPAAATAAAPTAALAAPAPLVTSAPSNQAPAVSASRSQPSSRTHGRRSTARRGGGAAGSATTAALTAALTAAPLTAPATSASTSGGPSRARGADHKASAAAQPPIVQTITKIVGVIPLAVWIAGGALLAIALALGAGSRLLAKRARRLERQRGELLADVGLLQTALLPVPPAGAGPVSTSAAYRPADGPAAGGDFYDVFGLEDGRLAIVVGDVSGHGRQALPHTALARFTLRAYLEAGLSPREALRTAGGVLEHQLGGALASALLATYQPRERTLVYACAGHPPPIVLGAHALEPLVVCAAPPIGAGMTTGTRQTVVSLPGATQVCFHTDGVTDARVGPELYGTQRLGFALASLGTEATAPALLARVAEQTDARPDDMAACLLSLQGDRLEPVTLVQELELYDAGTARERAERFLLACGLSLRESSRIAAEVREHARRAGSVLIEARPAGPGAGAPSARIRRDDLPDIHASDTRRLATVGGAR